MGDAIVIYFISDSELKKKFEEFLNNTQLKRQPGNQSVYFGYIKKHDLFIINEEVKKNKDKFKKGDFLTVYIAPGITLSQQNYVMDGEVKTIKIVE